MSGGAFNYVNETLEYEMAGRWEHPILNELFSDLFCSHNYGNRYGGLAQMLDYYLCGDISEESYRKAVDAFMNKWFNNSNAVNDITKKYIDEQIAETQKRLYRECGFEVSDE